MVVAFDVADIDGDGDMDVLSQISLRNPPVSDGARISWFENKGPEFQEQPLASFQESASLPGRSARLADFDSDGDGDIVFALHLVSADGLRWYENADGRGTFVEKQRMRPESSSIIEIDDVDGDGDLDLLSTRQWYENENGNGLFRDPHVFGDQNFNSIHLADFDGDDDVDLLLGWTPDDRLQWYRNEGSGLYETAQTLALNEANARFLLASDIDGDGDEDLIAGPNLAWFENTNGLGDFGTRQMIAESYSQNIFPADFDADGDTDIVTSMGTLLENDGHGTFLERDLGLPDNCCDLVADIDGNGRPDLVYADAETSLWVSNVPGQPLNSATVLATLPGNTRDVYAASDFDGDGDLDISLATNVSGGSPFWIENLDGEGSFGEPRQVPYSGFLTQVMQLAAADMDGDGDLDIVAAYDVRRNQLFWFENTDGRGTFAEGRELITLGGGSRRRMLLADLDGDDDADVLWLPRGELLENLNGRLDSGSPINLVIGAQPAVADFDGDGDQDVVTMTRGRIVFGENRTAGDIDGDGDVDEADRIVLLQHWTGALRPDTGDSTFQQGDTNGDGDVDSRDLTRLVASWGSAIPATRSLPHWMASLSDRAQASDPTNPSDVLIAAAVDEALELDSFELTNQLLQPSEPTQKPVSRHSS